MLDTMSVVVRAIIAVLPDKLLHCSVTGGGGGGSDGGGGGGGDIHLVQVVCRAL